MRDKIVIDMLISRANVVGQELVLECCNIQVKMRKTDATHANSVQITWHPCPPCNHDHGWAWVTVLPLIDCLSLLIRLIIEPTFIM